MAKLWGGRFSETEMDSRVMKFTSSLSVDKVLARYDCLSSKVHVEMLAKCGYVSQYERKELIDILDELSHKIEDGTANFEGYEDVHSAIQDYVQTKAPESGKKLHTARSRNEQVVNDVRLYSKDKVEFLMELVRFLQKNLVELAERTQDSIVPGYTHLNRAQPVIFSHLVMAYVEMLDRDHRRLEDAKKRMDVSVMGSGALAGSSLKLDRKFVAEKLGFKEISANSIDAVSDRDFMAEILSALGIIAVHLSRIAEDFILYSLPEFGFLEMGSKFCTGSSLMPQKKNPDVLELIRARAAGVISALNSLLVLMKGLPHSYNRDLQEDKGPFFGAIETVAEELAIMADLVNTIKLRPETAIESLEDEFVYSTDIAEYLVRKGMPFKEAHDVVGRIVKHCIENDIIISDLSIAEMKKFSAVLDEDVFGLLNAEASVNGKKTEGSTNPELVAKEIARWKKLLEK